MGGGLRRVVIDFATQRRMQPCAYVGRLARRTRVTENFNRLARLIHDHGAVFAVPEDGARVPAARRDRDRASIVVRNLADDTFAVQFGAPCRNVGSVFL